MKRILVGIFSLVFVSFYPMQNQLDVIEELEVIKEDLLMTALYTSVPVLDKAISSLRKATPGQERTYMRKAEKSLGQAASELANNAHLDYSAEVQAVEDVRAIHQQVKRWNLGRKSRPQSPQHPLRESSTPSLDESDSSSDESNLPQG